MNQTRRAFLATASIAATASLAGCTGNIVNDAAATIGLATPEGRWSYSTRARRPVIEGQPNLDDVQTAWGAIAQTPRETNLLFHWDHLYPETDEHEYELPTALQTFDPNHQFVTAIVGVLPYGKGLVDTDDGTQWDGSTVTYNVEPYQAMQSADTNGSNSSQPTREPQEPKVYFDYTFTLYNANGAEIPDNIQVKFHR